MSEMIPRVGALGDAVGRKMRPCPAVEPEKASLCVAYRDVGQGREQDAEALFVTHLE